MRKYFYKGESLSILLQTPVPETGERVKITDFEVKATIQGIAPTIETISDYEILLSLTSAQTKNLLQEGRADIIVTLTQGTKVVIGKARGLYAVDPEFARTIDGMEDTENLQLVINTGSIIFNMSIGTGGTFHALTENELSLLKELLSILDYRDDTLFINTNIHVLGNVIDDRTTTPSPITTEAPPVTTEIPPQTTTEVPPITTEAPPVLLTTDNTIITADSILITV